MFTSEVLISTAVVAFGLGVAYRVASLLSPQLMALLYHIASNIQDRMMH
nr:MAG TPA: hypothetical protein [Caudoviricetes sp.]